MSIFARRALAAAAILVACPAVSPGQEADPQASIRARIDDLGSPSYFVRTAAWESLRLAGQPALASLAAATNDPDPEVAFQAARLVRAIRQDLRLIPRIREASPWADPGLRASCPASGPGRTAAVCRAVAAATTWRDAIAAASFLDFQVEADRIEAELERAFRTADGGLARQHLVFLMAHAHPRGAEFCRRIAAGELGATGVDRFEAACALAFGGDPAALAALRASEPLPASDAFAGDLGVVPDYETYAARVEDAGDRRRLLAYRCYELLIGRPYFHILEYLFRERDGYGPSPFRELPFAGELGSRDRARARVDRLALFADLWPGHPGSDNAGLLAGELSMGVLDDPLGAAVRLAVAADRPDGDAAGQARSLFEALVLVDLGPVELARLASRLEPGADRDLVDYGRILATARQGSPGEALGLLARLDDPARAAAPWRTEAGRAQVELWREWDRRIQAERRADASDADERSRRLYAVAAHFYHNRNVLRPVGVPDTINGWSIAFRTWAPGLPDDSDERRRLGWILSSHHLARAAAGFARLRDEFPASSVLDKALFSEGLCYHKMKDDRAMSAADCWLGDAATAIRHPALTRRHVGLFAELVERFPSSNLADDAQRSIEYQIQVGNYHPAD